MLLIALVVLAGAWCIGSAVSAAVRARKLRAKYPAYKDVPRLPGGWPLVGHGFEFGRDIIGFVRAAHAKVGPMFRMRLFNVEMIVSSERAVVEEYFKTGERNLSLYEVLDELFFAHAFADDRTQLHRTMAVIKRSIAVRFEEMVPKIHGEAARMIERLRERARAGATFVLSKEMTRFVAFTSAACFMGLQLTDDMYADLEAFSQLLNRVVVLTYFLPQTALHWIFGPALRRYRMRLIDKLSAEIDTYRADPSKRDSLVLRTAVDYGSSNGTSGKGGEAATAAGGARMNNREVGEVIVALLYVSSENTALGLASAVTDAASKPDWWARLRREVQPLLAAGDMRGLYESEVLDASVFESARTNSHVFAINRKPAQQLTLGQWYLGPDVQRVALCEPMLMKYDAAADRYTDPSTWDPTCARASCLLCTRSRRGWR
jgi:cytochrome P450